MDIDMNKPMPDRDSGLSVPYYQKLGFLECPTWRGAKKGEEFFRIWGGESEEEGSKESDGVFLTLGTPDTPKTRLEAERNLAVMEYGNSCIWITRFEIDPGTRIWVGRADPGDPRFTENKAGSQVFVEARFRGQVKALGKKLLSNDLRGAYVVKPPRRRFGVRVWS